jgi:hypothetical protein
VHQPPYEPQEESEPQEEPDEPVEPYEVIGPRGPDYRGGKLIGKAQWTGLAAGFVTLAASIVTSAAVASSHQWGTGAGTYDRSLPGLVRGAGGSVVIGGIVIGILLAVLFYTVARGLIARPRGSAIFFFIAAALLAAGAAVLLAAPHLVMGHAGSAGLRPASSLADALTAGILLALAAALCAAAAGLALAALSRARRAGPGAPGRGLY